MGNIRKFLRRAITLVGLLLALWATLNWITTWQSGRTAGLWKAQRQLIFASEHGQILLLALDHTGSSARFAPTVLTWNEGLGKPIDLRGYSIASTGFPWGYMTVRQYIRFCTRTLLNEYRAHSPLARIPLLRDFMANVATPPGITPATATFVALPHWALVLAGLLPSLCALHHLRRHRKARRLGLCPACGYDLRASPQRCPECGAATPPPVTPRNWKTQCQRGARMLHRFLRRNVYWLLLVAALAGGLVYLAARPPRVVCPPQIVWPAETGVFHLPVAGEFRQVPLPRVLAMLSRQTGRDIHLDLSLDTLAEMNRPVDLIAPQPVPLWEALQVLCRQSGQLTGTPPLYCVATETAVVLTTESQVADHYTSTVVYDVRDLLEFRSLSQVPTQEEAAQDLIQSIQTACEPESWRAFGGLIGSIHEHGGRLIVQHTPRVHRQVEALLAALRK